MEKEWQLFYQVKIWPVVLLFGALCCFLIAYGYVKKSTVCYVSQKKDDSKFFGAWYMKAVPSLEATNIKIYRSDHS